MTVGQPDVLGSRAERDQEIEAGEGRGAGARCDDPDFGYVLSRQLQSVEDRSGDNDCRAVLIIVKNRDGHAGLQLLLDLEAFGRLDVFQIDAAEGRLERSDRRNHLLDFRGVDLDIEDIDAGELLEQDRLAFHDRLGCQRADVTETEDGGTVGDNAHEVGARRVE